MTPASPRGDSRPALSLLEQVLSNDSQEPFSRALKKLRRRLGPLRDLDVMIEHLEEVSATGRHALAAAWMTRQLEKERPTPARNRASTTPRRQFWARSGRGGAFGRRSPRRRMRPTTCSPSRFISDSMSLPNRPTISPPLPRVRTKKRTPGAQTRTACAFPGRRCGIHWKWRESRGTNSPPTSLRHSSACRTAWASGTTTWYSPKPRCGCRRARRWLITTVQPSEPCWILARDVLARADRELQKFVTLWKGKGADLAATIRAAFPLSKAMQAAPAQITPDQNKENVTELKTDRDPIGSAHMSDLEATPRGVFSRLSAARSLFE